MATIMSYKPGALPAEFVQTCLTVTDTFEEGEEGAWVSWAKASREEGGDDILEEMVKAQTVVARRTCQNSICFCVLLKAPTAKSS